MNLYPLCCIRYKLLRELYATSLSILSSSSTSIPISLHLLTPRPMAPSNLLFYWVSVREDKLVVALVLTPGLARHV